MSTVGVVNATALGEALVARLQSDGRKVVSGVEATAFRRMSSDARLILVDARGEDLPKLLHDLGEYLDPNHLVAHTVHGISAETSVAELVLAETSVRRTGVLAGPLLISALRQGTPTAAVIASRHPEVVEEFAEALSTPKLRVYRSRDPIGVAWSASLSELAVMACGMCDALELGQAARALLVVRATREMSRLVQVVGGEALTASGLAGLGDVLLRGVDESAPSYRVGRALIAKQAPDIAVLEDLKESAARVAKLDLGRKVSAHLFMGIAALLAGEISAEPLVERLMSVRVLDE